MAVIGENVAPMRYFNVWRHFCWLGEVGGPDIQWIEGMNAAKYPTVYGRDPTTKHNLVQMRNPSLTSCFELNSFFT